MGPLLKDLETYQFERLPFYADSFTSWISFHKLAILKLVIVF